MSHTVAVADRNICFVPWMDRITVLRFGVSPHSSVRHHFQSYSAHLFLFGAIFYIYIDGLLGDTFHDVSQSGRWGKLDKIACMSGDVVATGLVESLQQGKLAKWSLIIASVAKINANPLTLIIPDDENVKLHTFTLIRFPRF